MAYGVCNLNASTCANTISLLAACMVLGLTTSSALAETLPQAFVCRFDSEFFSYFNEGGKLSTSESHDTLEVTFASIDQKASTAQLVGNVGAGTVALSVGTATVNFVERTLIGNLILTTVFMEVTPDLPPLPTIPRRFFAVYSKHIGGFSEAERPTISQGFGSCEARW
jgi:hypothetical protein